MNRANFRRTLVGAAVATALGVLGSPAGAAPYRGTFDPDAFSGVYEIDVNPSCITMVDGWVPNSAPCSLGTMMLTSAIADVTNTTPAYGPGQLTFAPPPSALFGIYVYGGEILAFDSARIPNSDSDPPSTDFWEIQFVSGFCIPSTACYDYGGGEFLLTAGPDVGIAGAPITPLPQGVFLWVNQFGGGGPFVQSADFIGPAVAVPEPGTLALALGALGGGWLARRRRKQKEANSS